MPKTGVYGHGAGFVFALVPKTALLGHGGGALWPNGVNIKLILHGIKYLHQSVQICWLFYTNSNRVVGDHGVMPQACWARKDIFRDELHSGRLYNKKTDPPAIAWRELGKVP